MDKTLLQITYSFQEISSVAAQLLAACHQFRIVTLSGEMGAGKTTLTAALCQLLGTNSPANSPTFSVINEYQYNLQGETGKIYHMDLYRMKNTEEAINAGIEDCLEECRATNTWCFVEWPEQAPRLLVAPYVQVAISSLNETNRVLTATLVTQNHD